MRVMEKKEFVTKITGKVTHVATRSVPSVVITTV